MKTDRELKELVKEKYGSIVQQAVGPETSCGCGCSCGSPTVEFSVMAEDYAGKSGYVPEADLSLGCGIPTEFARIRPGDTVVDLGSGAGNDCFVARSIAGEAGKVIGVDMTGPMIEAARRNAARRGYTNVEFRLGDIEALPIDENTADVVVSNCVMNLVPDKRKAFSETYRILKPGGHFSISDIVLVGDLPEALRQDAAMYAGCVAGAQQKEEYLRTIREAGFANVVVQKERQIGLPEEVLSRFLSPEQVRDFGSRGVGIFSITVYGEKR